MVLKLSSGPMSGRSPGRCRQRRLRHGGLHPHLLRSDHRRLHRHPGRRPGERRPKEASTCRSTGPARLRRPRRPPARSPGGPRRHRRHHRLPGGVAGPRRRPGPVRRSGPLARSRVAGLLVERPRRDAGEGVGRSTPAASPYGSPTRCSARTPRPASAPPSPSWAARPASPLKRPCARSCCEWARWWRWVGVSGTGCWMPGHGDSWGRACCHEVTKRLLFSGWCWVGRLSWG